VECGGHRIIKTDHKNQPNFFPLQKPVKIGFSLGWTKVKTTDRMILLSTPAKKYFGFRGESTHHQKFSFGQKEING